MKKNIISSILLLMCSMLLTGCSIIAGGDDLLQPPKPSENFVRLQDQLEHIMNNGGKTYVIPQSGGNRNTVTFEDIDGDGIDEALAFLRDGTGGKIYLYAFAMRNGSYVQVGNIEGSGSALSSMSFINTEREKLIILTWTLSGDVKQGLSICHLQDGELTELLDTTCTDYIVSDLDGDKTQELFTLSYDDTERKTAQVYDYRENKMQLLSQADASQDVQAVANITDGQLNEGGQQAIFVDNKFEKDNGMQTDIYVLDKNILRNTALSASVSTYRSTSLYYCEDIDGDGAIEVPQLKAMPGYEDMEAAETLWMVDWYRYTNGGSARLAHTVYDSPTEKWMLEFPEGWRNLVTARYTSEEGVNRTDFVLKANPESALLRIYVFSGDGQKREEREEMIELGTASDISYAAELTAFGESTLSEKQLHRLFHVITNEWK